MSAHLFARSEILLASRERVREADQEFVRAQRQTARIRFVRWAREAWLAPGDARRYGSVMRIAMLALVCALGCGGAPPSPSVVTVQQLEVPEQGRVEVPEVELLDAGAEPRQALRLRGVPGQETALDIATDLRLAISVGGQAAPPTDTPTMHMVIGARVTDVDASGTIRRDVRIEDVSVEPHPLAAAISAELEPLRNMDGYEFMDARGRVLAAHFNVPENASQNLRESLERSQDMVQQALPPFPVEAVGIGARWRSVSRLTNRFTFTRDTEYELLAREGDRITLRATSTLSAEPQPMDLGQPGVEAEVNAYTGGGAVQMAFELDGTGSQADGTADGTLQAEVRGADGRVTPMSFETRVTMRIRSLPR